MKSQSTTTMATSHQSSIPETIPTKMKAWEVVKPGPIDGAQSPLKFTTKPVPVPQRGEVLVRVIACGVCHTDLHVAEGDLPVHQDHVTPGHEIVGKVVKNGPARVDLNSVTESEFHGYAGPAAFVNTVGR